MARGAGASRTRLPPLAAANSGGGTKGGKSLSQGHAADVSLEWSLPAQGDGPYRSSTYAIRENIKRKLEELRRSEKQREQFEERCVSLQRERLGARLGQQRDLRAGAEEGIRARSPAVFVRRCRERGAEEEQKGEEARRRKAEAERRWYEDIVERCDGGEGSDNVHPELQRRQRMLLRAIVVAQCGGIFASALVRRGPSGVVAHRRRTLGGALCRWFGIEAAGAGRADDAGRPAETPVDSVGALHVGDWRASHAGLMVLWRCVGVAVARMVRAKRRCSIAVVAHCLRLLHRSSHATRALRAFFYRVRHVQQLARDFVVVAHHHAELLEASWLRAERRLVRGVITRLPRTGGRRGSRDVSGSVTRSPLAPPTLLPPLGAATQPSPAGSLLEASLANPLVWRPRLAQQQLDAASRDQPPNRKRSIAVGAPSGSEEPPSPSVPLEVAQAIREALARGVSMAARNAFLARHLRLLRMVNMAAVHAFLEQRRRFAVEEQRLRALARRGTVVDPITGRRAGDELLLLTKPRLPLRRCLPPAAVIEAQAAQALREVLRGVPGANEFAALPVNKAALESHDAAWREAKEARAARRRQAGIRAAATRSSAERPGPSAARGAEAEPLVSFEFPIGLPSR